MVLPFGAVGGTLPELRSRQYIGFTNSGGRGTVSVSVVRGMRVLKSAVGTGSRSLALIRQEPVLFPMHVG